MYLTNQRRVGLDSNFQLKVDVRWFVPRTNTETDLDFRRNNTLSVLHINLLEYFIDSGYICYLRRSVIEECPNIS
jgi:hypothetical protein